MRWCCLWELAVVGGDGWNTLDGIVAVLVAGKDQEEVAARWLWRRGIAAVRMVNFEARSSSVEEGAAGKNVMVEEEAKVMMEEEAGCGHLLQWKLRCV